MVDDLAAREAASDTGVDVARDSETYRTVRISQLCELLRYYAHGEVYSLSDRLTATLDPPVIRRLVRWDHRTR